MSDTTITTRRVTQNPRTSQLAYAPITALPNGESATTESTVPSNPTASSPRYIKVGSQYYELKGKKPTADNIMFGEIAVAFPSGYERLYIKNSDTDIVEFAPNVDFQLYNVSGTDAEGNTITSLSVQQVANHIRLGYTVGNSLMMGEIITRTNTTPTSSDTFVAGNAYIYTQPLTEATFNIVSLVGIEDATTQETNIYFKVESDEVVIDVHETNTDASEHAALVHIGNYTSITQGVRYTGFADGKWYVITIRDNTVSCHPLDILVDVSGTGNIVTGITADGNKLTVSKGSVTANAAITSNNATTIGTITTPSGTTTLKSNAYALVQSGSDTIGLSVNGTDTTFYTINNVAHATRADRMKLFSYTDVIYPTGLDIDSTISANAIHVNDEVESAIHKVDTKLSAIISSMVDFEELMVSVGESIRYNVGLEPDYSYVNKPDPNVIVGATNIKEAIFMLDNALGTESADTGVTSGTYGPSTDVSGYTVTVPSFTVNSKGKLTQAEDRTFTVPVDNVLSTTSTNAIQNSIVTAALNSKQNLGNIVYDSSSSGSGLTLTVAPNTSYIYTNNAGVGSLTVNLTNVTGTTTSTANRFYEENIFFKAASNGTTVTLSNCNAAYIFGQYNTTNNTFSGFIAGQSYCLSIKDDSVVCGPVNETQLSLTADSAAGSYLVTGLSVDGHNITYNHLDLSSTDTTRFLRHDGQWQSVSNVSVTPILTSGDDIATINVNGTAYTLKSNAYTLTSTAATNGNTLHFKKNGSSSDQSTITVYDKQVKQNSTTENKDISILLRGTSTDANASEVKYATGLKYNPSTNVLESGSFKKTGGTSSQFLMADGSTIQYRVWDIINSVYAITVNSSLTQNSSAPSASSSTDTVAPGETLLFERALTSLTVDLTNVTGTNASPYEASIHFMAGDGLTYITLTGDHASFHYGSYAAGTSSYTGKFDNLQTGARYCLSIKDGAVICGPSEAGGGGNADAPIVHVVTNTSATALSLPDTGTDYELLPNNSYVYTVPLTSLSIDLANITGSTTNTDKYSGYSCIVYFQTGENMSTFTVSNNNATYTFGTYTNSGTTYTFNVSPSTAYVFTVKDNVVSVGPLNEEIILSTLETIRENVGLDPYYMYVNKPQPVVIDNATDLVAAVFMLDDAFGGVYTSIDSLGTDIALLSGTIDTMENALDTLGTTVLQLGTDVNVLNTRVNNIGTDVTNMKTSVARMGTDINIIYSTLTDMGTDINRKRDKGKFIYNTSATSATITMAYNTSYVYANANGLTSLTVNMGTVTSTPTVGTDNYSDRTYESTVYFMAHDNATTLTLNSCYATCVFGEYTKSGTTYTFNNFIANIWYCLSVKDNSVVCGPVKESPITTQTDSGTNSYLVTGISATDHTILYKKLAFENDTNKYLRSDGQWQPVQGSSGGTVTSVGLQMPSMYSIKTNVGTYAPIDTSGTFIVDFNSQTKNYVLAAPSTANGKPSFRALTATDIPQLSYNTLTDKPTPPVDTNQTVTTSNCNFGVDAAVRIQGTANGNISVVGANNTSPNTITISAPNMVNDLTWSSANLKLQKTKNGTSTDVLTFVGGNYINISSIGKTITIGTAGKMITSSFETASGVTIIYSDSSSDHLTNGRSVTIKGSLPSTADLASKQSTAVAGDSYLIDGDLWVFTGTTQTGTDYQYGFENVGEIQGPQGDQGPQGVGIGSISKTETQGLVDTYTVYSDESTPQSIGTFTVTNGSDGAPGADGATWYSGTNNPADSLGVVGDFYLKTSSTQQVILKKARSTGSNRWDTIATINNGSAYTLPKATSSSLGGVKIGYSESDSNYAVKLGTSTDMYVTVPWKNQKIHSGSTNFGTDADINITGTDGVSVYPNTSGSTLKIGLNAANTNTLGGIKAYATTSSTDLNTNTGGSQNYPVRLITAGTNANKAFVHVDWTDTRYKLTLNSNTKGTASSSTDLGGFYAPLSAGNSGDLLVSNGSGTGPSWFSPSSNGLLKKTNTGWSMDTNTYLTSHQSIYGLTLQLGNNASTTYNPASGTDSFSVPVFGSGNSYGIGLVPASTQTDRTNGYFLKADGSWAQASGGSGGGVSNVFWDKTNKKIRQTISGSGTDVLQFIEGVGVDISSTDKQITIGLDPATSTTLGGIKALESTAKEINDDYSEEINQNYPVRILTEPSEDKKLEEYAAFVQVPWTDTNTWRGVKINNTTKLDNTTTTALDIRFSSTDNISVSGSSNGIFTIATSYERWTFTLASGTDIQKIVTCH